MGWMLSFHKGPDDGSIESVTLRQKPIPHWLVAVADTTDGRIEHLLFAVILPNGYVIKYGVRKASDYAPDSLDDAAAAQSRVSGLWPTIRSSTKWYSALVPDLPIVPA
jgi:hypothetical protein